MDKKNYVKNVFKRYIDGCTKKKKLAPVVMIINREFFQLYDIRRLVYFMQRFLFCFKYKVLIQPPWTIIFLDA